jgi:hypothetical protein
LHDPNAIAFDTDGQPTRGVISAESVGH